MSQKDLDKFRETLLRTSNFRSEVHNLKDNVLIIDRNIIRALVSNNKLSDSEFESMYSGLVTELKTKYSPDNINNKLVFFGSKYQSSTLLGIRSLIETTIGNSISNIGFKPTDVLPNAEFPAMRRTSFSPAAIDAVVQGQLKKIENKLNKRKINIGITRSILSTATNLKSTMRITVTHANDKLFDKAVKAFLASTDIATDNILRMRGSKSIKDIFDEDVRRALNGRKHKNYSSKTSSHTTIKTKVKLRTPKLKPLRSAKGQFASLIGLQALMNAQLHDAIQSNMGTGLSTEILNYQTGRFARSAQVTQLVRTREDQIEAIYTYQRSPYDVFRPGGRLWKPGRDPVGIIGGAVRDVAAKVIGRQFNIVSRLE